MARPPQGPINSYLMPVTFVYNIPPERHPLQTPQGPEYSPDAPPYTPFPKESREFDYLRRVLDSAWLHDNETENFNQFIRNLVEFVQNHRRSVLHEVINVFRYPPYDETPDFHWPYEFKRQVYSAIRTQIHPLPHTIITQPYQSPHPLQAALGNAAFYTPFARGFIKNIN